MLKRIAAVLTLVAAVFALEGAAQAQSKAQIRSEAARVESFIISNTIFTLYHEVGHLVVDHHNMPVLGREEDVADNIASFILLTKSGREHQRILEEAALGWRLSGGARGLSLDATDFYDEHSLDLQRSFQIVCMMVGRDAETFDPVAEEWKMDPNRRERCKFEFRQVADTLDQLFNGYREAANGEPQVDVIFEQAPEELEHVARILRGSFALEKVADDIRTLFGLTRPVTIRATSCGQINAFYDPQFSEILFCYELADEFERQIVEQRSLR
jgi:hypothetical protein